MKLYLDHNATTPAEPDVLDRFVELESAGTANPASLHEAGRRARALLEAAREEVAEALGVEPRSIVFTSSGTEANNTAVLGLGARNLPVLLADVEHPSVLAPAARRGIERWSVEPTGCAAVAPPAGAVGMVALVHAQSETGALQPIAAAAELAQTLGVPLHVDAAQSAGRVDLAAVLSAADSLTISPHKLGGLRGCAVLVVKQPARLEPLLAGGGQESGLRPGTVPVGLIAANARAIAVALARHCERAAAMQAAVATFQARVQGLVAATSITPAQAVPNTVMLRFDAVADGRYLLPALDLAGIAASHGSACSSGSPEPPAVLRAMGLRAADARRCVRFSFDWRSGPQQAELAADRVVEVVRRLPRLAAGH